MVSFSRYSDQEEFGRYWDALVRGASPEELGRLAQPLDPEVVALAAQWRALRQARRPQPAFTQQLERDLMQSFALAQPGTIPLRTPLPQSPNGLLPPWRFIPSPIPERGRWALAQAAVTLLVILAIVAAYFSFVRHEDRGVVPGVATPMTKATPAADWPMYRGNPARTGEMLGPGPDGEPVQIWRFQAQGPTSRSPAIANGVAYVQSGDGNVYALDALTGAERWHSELGVGEDTPAVVGDTLYVNDGNGALIALDATTGQERWRFAESVSAFSTPIVVDGVLYAGSDEGNVYALDASSGTDIWQTAIGAATSRSLAVADGMVYAPTTNSSLFALDAASGEERWTFTADEPELFTGTPTVADGAVYFVAGTHLHALDAASGEARWTADFEGVPVAVAGAMLFGSGFDGAVYSFDVATGEQRWVFPTGDQIRTAPAVVGNTVYVASFDRTLYALDTATGEERWGYELDGAADYGPSIANGVLYVGTDAGSVYALGGSGMQQLAAPVVAEATPTAATAIASAPLLAPPTFLWQSTGGPEPLYSGSAVAIAPDENVWVVDAGNDRIQILSPGGDFLEVWDGTGGGGERFDFANSYGGFDGDLAFDAAGNVYVAEPGGGRVQVFAPDHSLLATLGGRGSQDLIEPIGIAVDGDSNAFVLDFGRNAIRKFDASGALVATFEGDGAANFRETSYIATDAIGNVWLAADDRIVELSGDGMFLREFGTTGDAPGQFRGTADVAVDANGIVFVTDVDHGWVQALTSEGTPLAAWDAGRKPSGGQNLPFSVALDNQGNLYVLGLGPDYKTDSNVQKFRLPPLAP